ERADFQRSLASVNEMLSRTAVPFQLPIGAEHDFKGVVDLIKMRAYTYQTDGSGKYKEGDIPADLQADADKAREALIEMVAENDESLMEKFFEAGTLTEEELSSGIQKGIQAGGLVPVFCASGTHNIGVAHLLDAIKTYIPSPADI